MSPGSRLFTKLFLNSEKNSANTSQVPSRKSVCSTFAMPQSAAGIVTIGKEKPRKIILIVAIFQKCVAKRKKTLFAPFCGTGCCVPLPGAIILFA